MKGLIIMFMVGLYFICSVVNVTLNTLKALFLARYNSKMLNCIVNAVTYGFYTIVLKQIAEIDLITAVVVTILTNIIGVYISLEILGKIEAKTQMYKISMTTNEKINKKITDKLNTYGIGYTSNKVTYHDNTVYSIDIYTDNKTEKNIVKEILNGYKGVQIRYHVTLLKTNL